MADSTARQMALLFRSSLCKVETSGHRFSPAPPSQVKYFIFSMVVETLKVNVLLKWSADLVVFMVGLVGPVGLVGR